MTYFFQKEKPDLDVENPVEIADGINRLLAPNPSIMTGKGTNTYLITSDEGVAVIDPGPNNSEHLDRIISSAGGKKRIKWIIATHTHIDHSEAVVPLSKMCDAKIVGFSKSGEFNPDVFLKNGDKIEMGSDEMQLESIHTPGHASDHISLLFHRDKILFTGDHIMEGSTVVIAPLDGSMKDYLLSLEKLLPRLQSEICELAPGHGQLIDNPEEVINYLISHRLNRESKVYKALGMKKRSTIRDLLDQVYSDVSIELHPIATYSLWAHLRRLVDDLKVTCEDPDNIDSIWSIAENP